MQTAKYVLIAQERKETKERHSGMAVMAYAEAHRKGCRSGRLEGVLYIGPGPEGP